jgi:hypothetical protein
MKEMESNRVLKERGDRETIKCAKKVKKESGLEGSRFGIDKRKK